MALGNRRVLDASPGQSGPVVQRPSASLFRQAPVCMAILALSVLTTVANQLTGNLVNFEGALIPSRVAQGEWYRLLTAIPTHAGFIHVFFNMTVVWTLGVTLERVVGSWRFAVISLVTALGSSTLVMWLAPDVPTVGASGMILGYAGAMLPISTREGRSALMTWLIQILIISALPGVSWQGHLGGFLFGLPCGVLLRDRAKYFGLGTPLLIGGSVLACALATFWRAGGLSSWL